MAKDIWERKPEKMLSTEARSWLAKLQEEWNGLQEKAEKLEAVKIWYETRIKKYNEQIEEGTSVPPNITQYVVSGILLKGLEGLGEILEVEG